MRSIHKKKYMLKIMIKAFKKKNKYRKLHLVKIIKIGESRTSSISLIALSHPNGGLSIGAAPSNG